MSRVFFAEFDGIVDAELETGMNHDQVRRLIMDTAAANGSATATSPSPPPDERRSSDSAAIIVAAEVYSSPNPPSHRLRQCPKQTEYLTYDERGMQVDMTAYRGDSN
ncbi:MAG: hypothetical protein GY832_24395 [Chloroflexi bacterium]|nr:hypothetical protein [Chloroflexota bacterium]